MCLIEWQDGIAEKETAAGKLLSQVFGQNCDNASLGSWEFGDLILDLKGFPNEGEGGLGTGADPSDYDGPEEYDEDYGFCRDAFNELLQSDGTAEERATILMQWYEKYKEEQNGK